MNDLSPNVFLSPTCGGSRSEAICDDVYTHATIVNGEVKHSIENGKFNIPSAASRFCIFTSRHDLAAEERASPSIFSIISIILRMICVAFVISVISSGNGELASVSWNIVAMRGRCIY